MSEKVDNKPKPELKCIICGSQDVSTLCGGCNQSFCSDCYEKHTAQQCIKLFHLAYAAEHS
jgi:hypothetical protein